MGKDVAEATKRVTRSSPKYSISCKRDTDPANSQTPQRVGPGSYPPMAPEMKYRTGPRFSIGKGEREKKAKPGHSGRLWDGMGNQRIKFNHNFSSPPNCKIGTGTRSQRAQSAPVYSRGDPGSRHAEHLRLNCPEL